MSLISIAKVEGEKVKMCKHGLTKYYEADKKCWVAGWTDWKWARRRGRKDHSCHTICPWAYEWLSEAFGARMYNQNFLLCNGKLICNRQLKEERAKCICLHNSINAGSLKRHVWIQRNIFLQYCGLSICGSWFIIIDLLVEKNYFSRDK